jgi:hypothetical protein
VSRTAVGDGKPNEAAWPCAAANPAIAFWLQSTPPCGPGRSACALRPPPHVVKLKRSFIQFAIATALVVISITAFARTIARPPTPERVAGIWSGYGDQIEFLRLELETNGTGFLCVSYLPTAPARLYRVESWRLSGWTVELQTRPIDTDAEAITFRKVRYSWLSLDGELGGSGWKRRIKLYGEREWQSRAVPAQERIARYRKEKQ